MGMFSEFLVETKYFRFKEKSEIGVRKGSLFCFGKKQEEIPKSYQEVCKLLFSDSEKIWLGIFLNKKSTQLLHSGAVAQSQLLRLADSHLFNA